MNRPFQFFDREAVDTPFIKNLEITCCVGGKGKLVFGDHEGVIRVVDASWVVETSFVAYDGAVTHLKQVSRNLLASIGNDVRNYAIIKFWDLAKRDRTGKPTNIRTLEPAFKSEKAAPRGVPLRLNFNPQLPIVFRGNEEEGACSETKHEVDGASLLSPVLSFDIAEDLDICVLGLSNGDICMYRGDLLWGRFLKPQFLSKEGPSMGAVNFVGLKKARGQGAYALFAVYEQCTSVWRIQPKTATYEQLAEFGAPPECVCLCEDAVAGDLAVARDDGIIFFAEDIAGQGACWAYEGTKNKIMSFRHNLVVVTEDVEPAPNSAVRRVVERQQPDGNCHFTITIYDIKNKFKVFSNAQKYAQQAVFKNISFLLSDGGSIFVITNEGGPNKSVKQDLWKLKEKDTQTKLEMLFKKHMYKEAINLAKSQQFDAASIAEITKKYGDRLYSEGKYDEAVDQYINTIPQGEPSYVIWKFLDAQRIQNLRRYLEALHHKKYANEDHTTLLLNCYTKLNDLAELNRFIRQPVLHYDSETAIKVCRQAGYYDNALHLALKSQDHNSYLKIQIEDLRSYSEALDYIRGLPLEDAEVYLQKYGKMLVSHLPEETTQSITQICTHWSPTPKALGTAGTGSPPQSRHLTPPRMSPVDVAPARTRSQPNRYQQCFVDEPVYLLRFLEFVVNHGLTVDDDNSSIWNTLLELYLTGAQAPNQADKVRQCHEALRILKDPKAKYDPGHALLLCQKSQFREGIVYLYEHKLGDLYNDDEVSNRVHLYRDLLNYYMQQKDHQNIVQLCKTHGQDDTNMWLEALLYFVQSDEGEFAAEISEILQHIDEEDVLQPLAVVRILAKNSKTKLATIKDYILHRLEEQVNAIEADRQAIQELQTDTRQKRAEIQELQTTAVIVQTNKCSHCHSALVIPAVHFLCKHSFHTRCLGEVIDECPLCQPQVRQVTEMMASLAESRDNHNGFFAHLRDSSDRFSTVAEYFGRNIFNGDYGPNPEMDTDSDSD